MRGERYRIGADVRLTSLKLVPFGTHHVYALNIAPVYLASIK
jgi:hypothetical protein